MVESTPSVAPAAVIAAAARPRLAALRAATPFVGLCLLLLVVAVTALSVGRYGVPFGHVWRILAAQVVPMDHSWSDSEQRVVLLVRLPRVLLAALIGGGLAISGAVLQAAFRNPLVNPQILGVSSGASFGGALALFFGLAMAAQIGLAFAFGLAALGVVFAVTRAEGSASVLVIVLGGVVTGAFFTALVSVVTYLADPYRQLPAIVFWLLGSLATATYTKVLLAAVPIVVGTALILALRWRVNVVSLGDDDARAVGVRPERLRWTLLVAVAAIVAGAVAVSGVIGWVGLVVPHLARMWVGPDHRVLLPVSFLMGASFLIVMDLLARSATAGELPLGALTALIGAPVFLLLLRRNHDRVWTDA